MSDNNQLQIASGATRAYGVSLVLNHRAAEPIPATGIVDHISRSVPGASSSPGVPGNTIPKPYECATVIAGRNLATGIPSDKSVGMALRRRGLGNQCPICRHALSSAPLSISVQNLAVNLSADSGMKRWTRPQARTKVRWDQNHRLAEERQI